MKKQINKSSNALLSFFGFLLFLLTIMITSTLSIVVYNAATKSANGNLTIINLSVLGVILFGAIFCTIFDIIRRKHMVEKPVNKILEATKKISSGEFEVQIDHIKEYNKYNEFDLIFDNINLMAAELAKNEILKNDFVSNVSHEIKTPIAVIQTYAQALQDKKLSEEKKSEYLNGLIIQTKKL